MRRFSFTTLLVNFVSVLPFPVLYMLSDVFYLVLYRLIGYRRKVVRENLRNAFPHKTASERLQIERKFFKHLPDVVLEAMKMRTISAAEINRRFRIVNQEEVQQHLDAGRPVVGISAHYANWEWGLHKLSLSVNDPVLIIYKPLSNRKFDEAFNAIRARFGAMMVPMKQTLRYLAKYRNQPHISIFLADQSPRYEESDYAIEFLNQQTLVFTGPAKMAHRMDAAMVYCHMDRVKRGFYQCTFTTLAAHSKDFSVHELTDLHTRFTENIIINKPEWWLWSHRRWKRKPNTHPSVLQKGEHQA